MHQVEREFNAPAPVNVAQKSLRGRTRIGDRGPGKMLRGQRAESFVGDSPSKQGRLVSPSSACEDELAQSPRENIAIRKFAPLAFVGPFGHCAMYDASARWAPLIIAGEARLAEAAPSGSLIGYLSLTEIVVGGCSVERPTENH